MKQFKDRGAAAVRSGLDGLFASLRYVLASALVAVSACGGGGSDGATPGDGGIGGTGVVFGGITGFGSVIVNGVEYNTDNATFVLDDQQVTQDDLRVGMVIRLDGSPSEARADRITVDEAIKGSVESVIDANRMIVMGQTVQIDGQTSFEDGVVPVAGDFVHVHGLVVGDGVVAAGFIERKAALGDPPFAVKGFVKNHDQAALTFAVGGLVVSYAGAQVNDMPPGNWDGQVVQVKGTACASQPACTQLTASKVEPNGPRIGDIAAAEFEGFVTSLAADGFFIGAQQVVVTGATVFENGEAADLVVGAKLEAEGAISGGVLFADKVSFRDNVRLEANIATIDGGSFTLSGLPGVTVQVSSLTKLGGGITSVSQLAAGNHVRVRGKAGPGNSVIATELDQRAVSPDTRVLLRGPVSQAADPSLVVLGIPVDTSTVSDFKNEGEVPIGRAAFFSALQVPGRVVQARGDLDSGAGVVWDEMELED